MECIGREVIVSTTERTPTLWQMVRQEALPAKDSGSVPIPGPLG